MNTYIKILLQTFFVGLIFSACLNDLDQTPIDPDSFTEVDVFKNSEEAKKALAKCYAAFALTGQKGPDGKGDIAGIDEGASSFCRMLFYIQEVSTDNSIISGNWSDAGIHDFQNMNWGSENGFIKGIYYRLAQAISMNNSFIANAETLASDPEVRYYINEARFLRAFAYYNMMDLFANVPLVTKVQTELPSQSNRTEIFAFIESELKELETGLKVAKTNELGRIDQAAAQALLSRLYLNAEVFINQNKYTECITYSKKVIASGYTINMNDANSNGNAYDELFLADNDTNGAQNEFIFALMFDGVESQSWGGSTFLVNGAIGGSMNPAESGVGGGWTGMRSTKGLVSKFKATSGGTPTAWLDKRAIFHTGDGTPGGAHTYEINDWKDFKQGYGVQKFKNIKSDGSFGNDPGKTQVDTNVPVLRLAEVYLNYAEAVARGGSGGSTADAVLYINALRERGFGNNSENITTGDLTIDFTLDERSRELYWEGTRRTDLIRHGKFTSGDYLWPYKGGIRDGAGVADHFKILPIPSTVLLTNGNLTQNPGY